MNQLDNLTINEKHFRELVEFSVDMIFRLNEVGDFIYANPASSQFTGYSSEELKKINFYELLKPEVKNQTLKFYKKQFLEKERSSYIELPLLKKDGVVVWIGLNMTIDDLENDEHILSGIGRDITDKIAIDKQKENWTSRLLVLIENMQEGILLEDENRKVVLVNRAFCDLFSTRLIPEDLIGKKYSNVQNHIKRLFEDKEAFERQDEEVVKNRRILIAQSLNVAGGRIYQRDFVPIYIETDYSGNLWKYRDNTENTKTKRELTRSQKKYKSVIEAMRLGLMEVDKSDNIITANDAFCEMLAYRSAEELVGKPSLDTLLDEDQKIQMMQQMSNRNKDESNTYEIKVKKADGGYAWLLICGTSLLDENDNVIGSMGIHLDISYQKRIAFELEEKKSLQLLMDWQEKAMLDLETKVIERTSEMVRQKDIIEGKNEQITRSIDYALRIQQALLPKKEDFCKAFKNNFILYKPKDIVSGDFYALHKEEENVYYVSAVDSTGHGVPGGFMSVLGSEKLAFAISKGGSTGQILSTLNSSIKTTLRNPNDEIGLLDGYDMALCKVDLNNYTLDFSGALRPIWVVKKNASEIIEIKGTRRSIGGRTKEMDVFDSHRVQLSEGDTFYIFTDGYADQFSGTSIKINSARLKEIVLSMQNISMPEQGNLLEKFFENWKSTTQQTDDVLVIGIKI